MDIREHLTLRTAPQVVFDALPKWASSPRFMVPDGDGYLPVTWAEFAAEIADVARYLTGVLERGDRACIFAPNRVEWMSAALGIQAAGGVMVPVYGSNTSEQAGYVIEHSDAKVVFVDTEVLLQRVLLAHASLGKVERIVLMSEDLDARSVAAKLESRPSEDWLDAHCVSWNALRREGRGRDVDLDALLASADLDENAIMLYTSGTSGQPKGVPLTHRNVGVNGRDWFECNGPLLEEGYTDLLWLPMSHIFGYGEVGIGNRLGWVSYLSDPKSVVTDLQRVCPNVLCSVPSVWEKLASQARAHSDDASEQLAELSRVTGGKLRFCLSGGAGLKRAVKELFYESGLLIIEGYGLTECSPTLTLNRPDAFRFDSVGKALPSLQLKLADDGEILAKGENIFAGYHKNPEATAKAFDDDGWFLTGDIGRMTEDGFLSIVDRKKDILVTAGGKNVAPANIELRFHDDPLIDHVVVYGDGEKYLVAGVWPSEAGRKEKGELQQSIDAVNGELARYETIKKFVVFDEPLSVESGFLTPTLKIRRKRIYEAFGERLSELYQQPRNV